MDIVYAAAPQTNVVKNDVLMHRFTEATCMSPDPICLLLLGTIAPQVISTNFALTRPPPIPLAVLFGVVGLSGSRLLQQLPFLLQWFWVQFRIQGQGSSWAFGCAVEDVHNIPNWTIPYCLILYYSTLVYYNPP